MIPSASKFTCKYCGLEFGLTDGQKLIVALIEIYSRVPLTCTMCRRVTVWHPAPKPLQKQAANTGPVVYSSR